jgi:hypothetical protein
MKNTLLGLLLLTFFGFSAVAQTKISQDKANSSGKLISIENKFITASFSPITRTVMLQAKGSNTNFVEDGFLEGAGQQVRNEEFNSPIFGKGSRLVIKRLDGGEIFLDVFDNSPFLFVSQCVVNNTKETVDYRKLNPFQFTINLNASVKDLKTLGTGGLLDPSSNSGSYLFLTTVNPKTREGVVTGWLTNERGSGVILPKVANNKIEINTQVDYGHLLIEPNGTERIETLVIGYFKDARKGEEHYADAIAQQLNIKLRKRNAVYCTWYAEKNGGAGNEKSTIELADFVNKNLKKHGMGVIQLDDLWQDGGKYNGPCRAFDRIKKDGPYPNGFSTTVKAINDAGLTAGIWWMPFARNHQDPEYKDRLNWFAKTTNGMPFETPWGGTSLDLTYPAVQEHLVNTAKTLKGWGFKYFKMDGLWTGTVTNQVYINDGYKNDSIGNCQLLYNPKKSQIQAYREGLQLLRNTVGDDVFFSGCCVSQNMRSFGASIGKVDAMRIGPDFNHDGQGIRTGVIRASRLYFLNGRIWWNDPDPSVVREKGVAEADASCTGTPSLETARILPSWVSLNSQFFLCSDWLPNLPNERMDILKRCMQNHAGVSRPIDAFDATIPSIWLTTDSASGSRRDVIGLFNWEKTSKTIESTLAWADLDSTKNYFAFDFWGNKYLGEISKRIAYTVPGENCLILGLRAKEGHPLVLSTSQHITQGIVDLKKENWKKNTLTGSSSVIAGDTYEIRIAGMNDTKKWKLARAVIVGDKNAQVKIVPQTEDGLIRVQITSSQTKVINWEVKFK